MPAYPGRERSSLSLVEFDGETGRLRTADEYFFEGLLPEDAVFDAEGRSLAVTVYNYREDLPREGAMEFWNVVEGGAEGEPGLERTGLAFLVTRGPHSAVLLP